jgi:peptidoglycan/LPS O-acetylase OafA/YrhL
MVGAFTGNWWVYYGLLQNLPVYDATGTCAVDGFRCGVPVAWSLTVEVLFYLALPFFVLLMGRLHRRRPRVVGLPIELAAVAVLTAISIVILSSHPESDLDVWLFYSPLGRGWWFGLGLALAALSVAVERRPEEHPVVAWIRRHPLVPWLLAAALYVVDVNAFENSLLAFPLVPQSEFVAQYLLVGAIGALVLLPAIFGREGGGLPRRVLAHPTLAWLGLVSYGIFLWQIGVMVFLIDDLSVLDLWPAMDFPVLLATGFAGTVACAAASFYLLERPLMGWRAARPRRPQPARGEA